MRDQGDGRDQRGGDRGGTRKKATGEREISVRRRQGKGRDQGEGDRGEGDTREKGETKEKTTGEKDQAERHPGTENMRERENKMREEREITR